MRNFQGLISGLSSCNLIAMDDSPESKKIYRGFLFQVLKRHNQAKVICFQLFCFFYRSYVTDEREQIKANNSLFFRLKPITSSAYFF